MSPAKNFRQLGAHKQTLEKSFGPAETYTLADINVVGFRSWDYLATEQSNRRSWLKF